MHSTPLRIVHLEDSPNDALLIEGLVTEEFHRARIVRVETPEAYLREISDPETQIVLSDYSLPSYDGISALATLRRERPEVPFIFVSGAMGEDMAVECMKIGATDYILKANLKRLPSAIRRALSEMDTRRTLTEAARVAKVVPWHRNEAEDTWLFGYLVRDILGYAPDLLRSQPGFLRSKLHPEDLSRFASVFERSKDTGGLDVDCRIQHQDGRWLWTRWTLAWSDGKCRGVLQDISELRSAQDALIQSQRIETLGMMIGGITHDFGNLLTAMAATIDLLSAGALSATQRRHLDVLDRSCARAREFRDELLRLARKEDSPARTIIDLAEPVREATHLLGHALPKSVALDFEPGERVPGVRAVPAQIIQVVMNLGLNACDAMGGAGRLRISTGSAGLSESEALAEHRPSGPYAWIDVEDEGPGIPPEVVAHMFEPFFTTKPPGRGTGLGLAMVRAIVQQHDGLIRLWTEHGKGSRFRIMLPAG